MLHAHNTLGMDTPHATPPDPVSLIDTLDPDAIAARLEELVREQDALRVLLRAAGDYPVAIVSAPTEETEAFALPWAP